MAKVKEVHIGTGKVKEIATQSQNKDTHTVSCNECTATKPNLLSFPPKDTRSELAEKEDNAKNMVRLGHLCDKEREMALPQSKESETKRIRLESAIDCLRGRGGSLPNADTDEQCSRSGNRRRKQGRPLPIRKIGEEQGEEIPCIVVQNDDKETSEEMLRNDGERQQCNMLNETPQDEKIFFVMRGVCSKAQQQDQSEQIEKRRERGRERVRLWRLNEEPEKRRLSMEKKRIAQRQRRLTMNATEREMELETNRMRKRMNRRNEDETKKKLRRQKDSERRRLLRQNEDPEQRRIRLEKDRQRIRDRRKNEDPETREMRLERERHRMKERRRHEDILSKARQRELRRIRIRKEKELLMLGQIMLTSRDDRIRTDERVEEVIKVDNSTQMESFVDGTIGLETGLSDRLVCNTAAEYITNGDRTLRAQII